MVQNHDCCCLDVLTGTDATHAIDAVDRLDESVGSARDCSPLAVILACEGDCARVGSAGVELVAIRVVLVHLKNNSFFALLCFDKKRRAGLLPLSR